MKILFSFLFLLSTMCQAESFAFTGFNVFPCPTDPTQRPNTYPYISGDTFRSRADWILDETCVPFDTDHVKDGDVIFLNTGWIVKFLLEIHPLIKAKYILLTSNADTSAPDILYGLNERNTDHGRHILKKIDEMLNSETLAAWFCINVTDYYHEKIFALPIGIPNPYWGTGAGMTMVSDLELLKPLVPQPKRLLVIANFWAGGDENTFRGRVYKVMNAKGFCKNMPRKKGIYYLHDFVYAKFCLSPYGAGMDCYRNWEAMLMDCIPIIPHGPLDALFNDLPVVLVHDYADLSVEFLNRKFVEIEEKKRRREYKLEKLYSDYWLNIIKEAKRSVVEKGDCRDVLAKYK